MRRPAFQALLAPLLALGACQQESNIAREKQVDTFYQEPPANVDILWVVDNSNSMSQEQDKLAERFQNFIDYMDTEETEIDFHLGVVTTDMDADNPYRGRLLGDPPVLTRDIENYTELFEERVHVGIDGSDKERGLEAAYVALTEPMISDVNAGFLRDDAMLAIIFVSDENDCSDRGGLPEGSDGSACYHYSDRLVPVKEYVEAYRDLKESSEDVIVSAIVGPDVEVGCEDTWPGTRYLSVASSFGGIQGNICEDDFTGMMEEMGLSVSGVRSSFELSYPAVEDTIEVYLCEEEVCDDSNSTVVPRDEQDGWTYDPDTHFIYFHGDAVPPRGSTVTVVYEISAT